MSRKTKKTSHHRAAAAAAAAAEGEEEEELAPMLADGGGAVEQRPPEWMTASRASKRISGNNRRTSEEQELLAGLGGGGGGDGEAEDDDQDDDERRKSDKAAGDKFGGDEDDDDDDDDYSDNDSELDGLDEATIAWAMRPPAKSIWQRVCYEADDILSATLQALNWGTLFAIFVAFCASYYATVGRFTYTHGGRTTHTIEGIPRHTMDMLGFADQVRVLPELYELATLKHDLTHLRSTVGTNEDAPGEWSNVTLGMHAMTHYVHGHSHMRLPPVWFDCLHVGVAAHDLFLGPNATTARELEDTKRRLMVEMQTSTKPAPSAVLPWYATHNRTGFVLEGMVARYCLSDLEQQGYVAKTKHSGYAPAFNVQYARAIAASDRIGRAFGQLLTVHWYQHQWGTGSLEDPLQHTSILQDINPIRSGVQTLRYTGVAYRTNAPVPPIDPGIQRIDMSHLANI